MNEVTFLQNFKHVANAPNGVQRLRSLILHLAVSGRLVRSDDHISPSQEFPLLADSAISNVRQLPANWLTTPLKAWGEFRGGGTPSKSNAAYWRGDIPWVSPKGIQINGQTPPADWLKEAQDVTDELFAAEQTSVTSAAYRLELLPSLCKFSDVTQTGHSLVVVADVIGKIHVRVFDGTGARIIDASQPKNDHKTSWFAQLTDLLASNWDQSKLKPLEIKDVFRLCEMISRRYLTSEIIEQNQALWKDDRVRNWMLGLFNNKCWYSEAQESVSSYHVDHFRPKGRITDDLTTDVADGYWWLAFSWTNYRIGGALLNSKKKDVFPLADPTRATYSDASSVAKECPILIDPLVEEEARLISYEWRDAETCVAVRAGDITADQASRVDRTIEILGLNLRPRLNEKRAQLWEKCRLAIADYKGANGPSCFARIEQAKAKTTLKGMIKYDAEFSSVAEACVLKTAPMPLISAVFGH